MSASRAFASTRFVTPPDGDPRRERLVHDLNNALGGLVGLTDLLGRERNLSPAGRKRVAELRASLRHAAELVAELTAADESRNEGEPGAGTSFEILLQRANETTGPDSTPDPEFRTEGTVLLVEDDDVLRMTYEELLTGQGLTVITAGDGFNALLRASSHPGRIDLLVSDILLPQMSGIELWRKLSRFRPEAQVLFMSGNLNQAKVMLGSGSDAPELLGKPFTATALLATVNTLLARSPFLRPGGPAGA